MQENYFCFNDKFYLNTSKVFDFNRAMAYGDGAFETIKIINGSPKYLTEHLVRLKKTLSLLKIENDSNLFSQIKTCIDQLIIKNDITKGGRLKVVVFRKNGGYYLPKNRSASFVIEATAIEQNEYSLNKKGLNIGIADQRVSSTDVLSNYKTLNKLPYVLAAMEAEEIGLDDVLLLNENHHLVESSNSNLFLVIDRAIITPPLKDGCLNGVCRNRIIDIAKQLNISVTEASIDLAILEKANEVFLTNSIAGISWVGSFGKKRFLHTLSSKLIENL